MRKIEKRFLIEKYSLLEMEACFKRNQFKYNKSLSNPECYTLTSEQRKGRDFYKVTEQPDCALFYQLLHTVDAVDKKTGEESLIKKYYSCGRSKEELKDFSKIILDKLIYIDFAYLSKISEEVLKGIFDNGITFICEDGREIKYVYFEASGSMRRTAVLSFIDEKYKEKLLERLTFGMPDEEKQVCLSKYWAYKGLYLTSGHRINTYYGDEERHERLRRGMIKSTFDVLKSDEANKIFNSVYADKAEEASENLIKNTCRGVNAVKKSVDNEEADYVALLQEKVDKIFLDEEKTCKEKGAEAEQLKTLKENLLTEFVITKKEVEEKIEKKLNHNVITIDNKTVVIVKDYTDTALIDNYTGFEIKELDEGTEKECFSLDMKGTKKYYRKDTKDEKVTVKLFDGEGLISQKYAARLARAIKDRESNEDNYGSFQIRAPFIKGMLHRISDVSEKDENGNITVTPGLKWFFDKFGVTEITDIFGDKHKVEDVEIVLTKSMFKCEGWMPKDNKADWFWKKCMKYDHALYVVGSNNPGKIPAFTSLNSQVLSTCGITNQDFDSMVWDFFESVQQIQYDDYALMAYLSDINCDATELENEEQFEKDPDEEDDGVLETQETGKLYYDMIKKNPAVIKTEAVTNMRKDLFNKELNEFALAHIPVKGGYFYLSGNLMDLLFRMTGKMLPAAPSDEAAKNKVNESEMTGGKISVATSDELPENEKNEAKEIMEIYNKHIGLGSSCFYAPNSNFKDHVEYAFFRNPHLSQLEDVSLACHIPEEKDNWKHILFGSLRRVVMVDAKYLVPMCLGGADFDGDGVKIIRDKYYCNSVKNSIKENADKDNANKRNKNLGNTNVSNTNEDNTNVENTNVENTNVENTNVENTNEENTNKDDANKDNINGNDANGRGGPQRKISVVDIPAPNGVLANVRRKNKTKKDKKKLKEYEKNVREMLLSTFNSRTGYYSNRGFELALKAYSETKDENARKLTEVMTAIVGLEIDSAKNGAKPKEAFNLSEIERSNFIKHKTEFKKRKKEYAFKNIEFVTRKKWKEISDKEIQKENNGDINEETQNTDEIREENPFAVYQRSDSKKNNVPILESYFPVKKAEENGKTEFYHLKKSKSDVDTLPPVERIGYLYLWMKFESLKKECLKNENEQADIENNYTSKKVNLKGFKENSIIFDFEKTADWEKSLEAEKLYSVLGLMLAYKNTWKNISNIYRYGNNKDESSSKDTIRRILENQGNGNVEEEIKNTFDSLACEENNFSNVELQKIKSQIYGVKGRTKEKIWQYGSIAESLLDENIYKKLTQKADEIIDIKKFKYGGYNLLYYIADAAQDDRIRSSNLKIRNSEKYSDEEINNAFRKLYFFCSLKNHYKKNSTEACKKAEKAVNKYLFTFEPSCFEEIEKNLKEQNLLESGEIEKIIGEASGNITKEMCQKVFDTKFSADFKAVKRDADNNETDSGNKEKTDVKNRNYNRSLNTKLESVFRKLCLLWLLKKRYENNNPEAYKKAEEIVNRHLFEVDPSALERIRKEFEESNQPEFDEISKMVSEVLGNITKEIRQEVYNTAFIGSFVTAEDIPASKIKNAENSTDTKLESIFRKLYLLCQVKEKCEEKNTDVYKKVERATDIFLYNVNVSSFNDIRERINKLNLPEFEKIREMIDAASGGITEKMRKTVYDSKFEGEFKAIEYCTKYYKTAKAEEESIISKIKKHNNTINEDALEKEKDDVVEAKAEEERKDDVVEAKAEEERIVSEIEKHNNIIKDNVITAKAKYLEFFGDIETNYESKSKSIEILNQKSAEKLKEIMLKNGEPMQINSAAPDGANAAASGNDGKEQFKRDALRYIYYLAPEFDSDWLFMKNMCGEIMLEETFKYSKNMPFLTDMEHRNYKKSINGAKSEYETVKYRGIEFYRLPPEKEGKTNA